MFLSYLRVDFLRWPLRSRCVEIREEKDEFQIHTGSYRKLRIGEQGLRIGAEVIWGSGWSIRQNGLCDPIDYLTGDSEAEQREFQISYAGITPANRHGAYNLVLPTGWTFVSARVKKPDGSGHEFKIRRDVQSKREALALYFEGRGHEFRIKATASRAFEDSKRLSLPVPFPAEIVEPRLAVSH
jgi:hypothetical protein